MYKIPDLKIGWFFFFQLKICQWFGKKIALQNYFYLDRIQYLNYPSWKIPIVWSLYPQLCHSCVIMMYCIVNNPFFKFYSILGNCWTRYCNKIWANSLFITIKCKDLSYYSSAVGRLLHILNKKLTALLSWLRSRESRTTWRYTPVGRLLSLMTQPARTGEHVPPPPLFWTYYTSLITLVYLFYWYMT